MGQGWHVMTDVCQEPNQMLGGGLSLNTMQHEHTPLPVAQGRKGCGCMHHPGAAAWHRVHDTRRRGPRRCCAQR